MIDDFAKAYLHDNLRWAREGMLGKLEGLSEYDARRPLTTTGTNVLGMLKHLAIGEAHYLGAIVGRPYAGSLPRFDDPGYDNRDHLWVRPDESRADVVRAYRSACDHADATIEALPVDAPGFVPWWPRPDVKLFNLMVHVLTETNRHLGQADILREQLDGVVGDAGQQVRDDDVWAAHRATVEQAARAAAGPTG